MGLGYRTYIVEGDGSLSRISNRVYEGLVDQADGLPNYAGQRIKLLYVVVESENGKPVRITRSYGSFIKLDDSGVTESPLIYDAHEFMKLREAADRKGKVVNLEAQQKLAKWTAENDWAPTKEHLDRVAADVWPEENQPRIRLAKSSQAKPPPVPHAAQNAMKEIKSGIFKISLSLDRLSEPAMKGLAHLCRQEAENANEESDTWEGIAQWCDYHLEIRRRHRKGDGVWYAAVEFTRWRRDKGFPYGDTVASFHKKCDGRKIAIQAARRLLKEHADKLDKDLTVEASVCTDLEWENI